LKGSAPNEKREKNGSRILKNLGLKGTKKWVERKRSRERHTQGREVRRRKEFRKGFPESYGKGKQKALRRNFNEGAVSPYWGKEGRIGHHCRGEVKEAISKEKTEPGG